MSDAEDVADPLGRMEMEPVTVREALCVPPDAMATRCGSGVLLCDVDTVAVLVLLMGHSMRCRA